MYLRLEKLLGWHWFILVPPIFFFATVCQTIGFSDTALLVGDIEHGAFNSHVNNHPLTVLTGMLFSFLPVGELAFRANLVSVFYGSLTVITFYFVLSTTHKSKLIAALGSTLLMLCHSMWWHSTIIENYTATAFLVALCLYFWVKLDQTGDLKNLYLLCFTASLGMLNHVQMSFVCLGVLTTGLWIASKQGYRRVLPGCATATGLGLMPWMILILRDAAATGSVTTAIQSAFIGKFSQTFFGGQLWASVYDTIYLLWFQSPTLYMIAFGLTGIYLSRSLQNPTWTGMIVALTINLVNFSFYPTWDKFAFLLLSFVFLYFFASFTLKKMLNWCNTKPKLLAFASYLGLTFALAPYVYNNAASWGLNPQSLWHKRYSNLYSNNAYFQSEYIVNPNKRNFDELDQFARLLFEKLPKNAIFLDDDSRSYYTLARYYQRHLGLRPDVTLILVNSWGMKDWGIEGNSLAKIIRKSYLLDKPFFTISNRRPINGFLMDAKKSIPNLALAKFSLNEDRWVYRLKTRRDFKFSPKNLTQVQSLDLTTAKGYFDIEQKDVAFLSTGTIKAQNMSKYLGGWQSDDHLFFDARKTGANLEFYLKSLDQKIVDLSFWVTAAPDFGRARISANNREAVVDTYDSSVSRKRILLRNVKLNAGFNPLQIQVLGKNPKSRGYKLGIDGIEFAVTGH